MNVASRLESSGVLGRIQVSEQVAQILLRHGHFEVECRGPIEVRGKGLLTTYLVVTPYDNDQCDIDSTLNGNELDAHCVEAEGGGGGGGGARADQTVAQPAPAPPPPPPLDEDDSVEELRAGSGSLTSSDEP